MIWLSLATGFAGGLAIAVVGIPILLWILVNGLDEELQDLHSAIRRLETLNAPSNKVAPQKPPVGPLSTPSWPDPLAPGRQRPAGEECQHYHYPYGTRYPASGPYQDLSRYNGDL